MDHNEFFNLKMMIENINSNTESSKIKLVSKRDESVKVRSFPFLNIREVESVEEHSLFNETEGGRVYLGDAYIESGYLNSQGSNDVEIYSKMVLRLYLPQKLRGKNLPSFRRIITARKGEEKTEYEKKDHIMLLGYIPWPADLDDKFPVNWACPDYKPSEQEKRQKRLNKLFRFDNPINPCFDECSGLASVIWWAYTGVRKVIKRNI